MNQIKELPMKKQLPTFRVGDLVVWDSQAGGSWMRKLGRVERVIGAHVTPYDVGLPLGTASRDHEWYAVKVEGVGLMAPRRSALRPATPKDFRRAKKAGKRHTWVP